MSKETVRLIRDGGERVEERVRKWVEREIIYLLLLH